MFYMIGLGLSDKKDITVKGLEAVKSAKKIYLECYTSKLDDSDLEEFYGKEIIKADRDMVEMHPDDILQDGNAFLVVGDVFGATTHTDLYLRGKEKGLNIKIINNASILNAVGITGLELYKFGRTTSIPYPEDNFKPQTAYDVIKMNQEHDLHTLCLLDIKPDRNMTVNEALQILLDIEKVRGGKVITEKTKVVGCARIGSDNHIKYGTVKEILQHDFGTPLHCLIVPGKLHFIEEDMLKVWK